MKLLIDTNRYSDFARGDAVVVEQVRTAEQICIPFVVLAELRAGFLAGTRPREYRGRQRSKGPVILFPLMLEIRHQGGVRFHDRLWIDQQRVTANRP